MKINEALSGIKITALWKCPGQNITQMAEIRDNYIFEGWKNQETGMIEKEWPFVLDDNIIFDSQGGSAVAPIIGIVPGNVISEPENPIYENFIFRG